MSRKNSFQDSRKKGPGFQDHKPDLSRKNTSAGYQEVKGDFSRKKSPGFQDTSVGISRKSPNNSAKIREKSSIETSNMYSLLDSSVLLDDDVIR